MKQNCLYSKMTTRIAALCAGMLFVANASFSQTNWQLVWDEEFDYTGLPDANKWGYDVGCATNNNEKQVYAKERLENSRVENGNLVIEARKEAFGGCNYTSARLVSKGKGDWLYGKMEVRAQIPTGRGTWPAIWMLSTDNSYGGWPKSGEIDIMENVGYDPNTIVGTLHTDAYNHTKNTQKSGTISIAQPYAKFCVYAVEWYKDSIQFFVDGVKYYGFKREAGADYTKWPFDKRFHMILNLAIGGDWGGARGIDDAIFPQKFYVDYVRIYQAKQTAPYTVGLTQSTGGIASISPEKLTYNDNELVTLSSTPSTGYEFIGWSSDFFASSPVLDFTVNRNISFRPVFRKIGELLKNGDFSQGVNDWLFQYYSGAASSLTLIEGGVEINNTTLGTNIWNVQLIQTNLALYNGKTYELSFDIVSDNDMAISGGVGMNGDPWTNYTSISEVATSTKSTIKQRFKMRKDDLAARLAFDLGTNLGKVKITNVSLIEVVTAGIEEELNVLKKGVYLNSDKELVFKQASNVDHVKIYNLQGQIIYQGQAASKIKLNQNAIVLVNYKDGRTEMAKIMAEVF